MEKLIKAECFKLVKSSGFKILLFCSLGLGIIFSCITIISGSKVSGYDTFNIFLGMILLHSFLGYVFSAIFICNEYKNSTLAINLLSGFSRKKIFTCKIIIYFLGILLLCLISTISATIIMSFVNGYSVEPGKGSYKDILTQLLYAVSGYMALGAVIILITVITKKAVVTIASGISLTYILLFLRTDFKDIFFVKYTYSYQIELLRFQGGYFSGKMYMLVMFITFVLTLTTALFIFEKMELK